MQQLEGFVVKGKENMIWKLQYLYGLSNFLMNGTTRLMHIFHLKNLKGIMLKILFILRELKKTLM
jgi:hypothetical protein